MIEITPTESGASLRAAGFKQIGMTEGKANGWSVPSRPREMAEKYPTSPKIIWEIKCKRKDVST